MKRKKIIYDFLDAVCDIVMNLHDQKEEMFTTHQIGDLNIINLSSALNLLRQSLDYISAEIFERVLELHLSKKPRVYFPYGKNENDFKARVNSSLPTLKDYAPSIYDLLESVQPYKLGSDEIYHLCLIQNVTKHNCLVQIKERKECRVEVGDETVKLFAFQGRMINCSFSNNIIRYGDKIIDTGNIYIGDSYKPETVTSDSEYLHYEEGKLLIQIENDDSISTDILELVADATYTVEKLVTDVYEILDRDF